MLLLLRPPWLLASRRGAAAGRGGSARLRGAAAAAPSAAAVARAHGIDCACYFTENLFVREPVEGHFSFRGAADFASEHAPLLEALSAPDRAALIGNLEAEAARRRGLPAAAAARAARIARDYVPLHPELWALDEAWLHADFVALVRGLGAPGWRPPRALAEGVYALPVFSPRFCALLCEELDAFARSGLPCGQPNSMNRHGALLGELGLSAGLLDPLVEAWLRPLCAALPPLAAAGGGGVDHHKSFVVKYRRGEDEELATHYDNAEVTLNANLGLDFEGGELVFHGHKLSAAAAPRAHHAWDEGGVGHGVLHVGAQVHAALPIGEGERRNLVVWMRSAGWRARHGCPMCGGTDRLLA